MFMAWQKAVGGRIKSDLRFNKLLTWNTFPLPNVSAEMRQRIIDAGQRVLAARPPMETISLADMYGLAAIEDRLLEAHSLLDCAVDELFGIEAPLSELERQAFLLPLYEKQRAKKARIVPRRK